MTSVASAKAGSRDWAGYYERTLRRPPRETLLEALRGFEREGRWTGRAIDLGSGGGRDTVELLRRGWSVLAIDAAPESAVALGGREDLPGTGALVTRIGKFEAARWPAVDLVNASFALPLCPPGLFQDMWEKICITLLPGGRFCGQLYGERDDFARDPNLTCHTAAEVAALFDDFEIEMSREEESDAVTPRGRRKHWHVWHIVARKP